MTAFIQRMRMRRPLQSLLFWSCGNWIAARCRWPKRLPPGRFSNLRDGRGFFYYQRRRFYTVRTPYMRWTQGWMLYALARLLEEKSL